jgi:CheY-like chemotaxis protein
MKTLVVDDNLANREVARHVLEMDGFNPVCVPSGTTAIQAVHASDFALILMDINMPGMCGLETTLRLRQLERPGRRIPIFALTAYCAKAELQRYLEMGLDGVLSKPLQMDRLRKLTQGYISPSTMHFPSVDQMVKRLGQEGAVQHYSYLLERAERLREDDSFQAYKSTSVAAHRMGLPALSTRLNDAAHVPEEWREIAVTTVRTEVGAARRFLIAGLGEALSPGRDARRA